jgi:hypothetical protein
MLQPRTLRLLPPLVATGLLALAPSAHAQEHVQLQQQPSTTVQLAPLPPQQQGQQAPTVVIQQQYPQPMYQQAPQYAPPPQYGPPPGPTYYVQAPQAPAAPPLGPRVLRNWDDSQPVPPGYHVEEHARKGLVIGGAVMFGTMYLLTALGAAIAQDNGGGAAALWVPAVGPFIQMGQSGSATGGFLLALDGVIQVGGLAMFTIGLAAPRTEVVRDGIGSLTIKVSPIIAGDSRGMGLVGTF